MDKKDEPSLPKKAVALRYKPGEDAAPTVVAKGKGLLAERIQEVARENGVFVREDRDMVNYLMALDLYQEIPAELYTLVAEILAHIYSMDKKF